MGRAPCCDKEGVKKGPWTPDEDQKLVDYIKHNGHGSWRTLPKRAGLLRCGKSCRLRWTNYLRPDIKRGKFSFDEEQIIIQLHGIMGNKWSAIAARLPGRTDNEIKNYWNSRLRKRLLQMGIDPVTHRPTMDLFNFADMNHFLGSAGFLQMTAEWEKAWLQEEMMREYYLRIASARNDQNTGAINATDLLMRSQLESTFSRPDFSTDSILSHILAQNPQNQPESLEYNTLITRALQQLQSQSLIMNNLQHLSPTPILDGLSTHLQHHNDSSEPSLSAPMINSQTTVIPDQNSNPHYAHDNVINAWNLVSQQQPPSKNHDINSSLALDGAIMWPENHLSGFYRSDVDSDMPALLSSTSSPGAYNDPDLVPETSSSIANMNANMSSSTSSPFSTTCDESYGVPLGFFLNSTGASEGKEKIGIEKVEDEQVYWRNILSTVAESL